MINEDPDFRRIKLMQILTERTQPSDFPGDSPPHHNDTKKQEANQMESNTISNPSNNPEISKEHTTADPKEAKYTIDQLLQVMQLLNPSITPTQITQIHGQEIADHRIHHDTTKHNDHEEVDNTQIIQIHNQEIADHRTHHNTTAQDRMPKSDHSSEPHKTNTLVPGMWTRGADGRYTKVCNLAASMGANLGHIPLDNTNDDNKLHKSTASAPRQSHSHTKLDVHEHVIETHTISACISKLSMDIPYIMQPTMYTSKNEQAIALKRYVADITEYMTTQHPRGSIFSRYILRGIHYLHGSK